MSKEFTEKQNRFIQCYDGNATTSAITAGYSKKTAYSQGQRLLKNVEISSSIKKRLEKKVNKLIANREDRQEFWTKVMSGKNSMSDRLRASELLGRSEADFTDTAIDNSQHTHYHLGEVDKDGPIGTKIRDFASQLSARNKR